MFDRRFVNRNVELSFGKDAPGNPSCTLLIPEADFKSLEKRLEFTGFSLAKYLRVLMRRYRGFNLEKFQPPRTHFCRLYQGPGQSLIKRNFRPDAESWVELGVFAEFLGISRCLLFVLLMRMDIQDIDGGDPADEYQRYDLNYPEYIQCRTRVYVWGGPYKRNLISKPKPIHRTIYATKYLEQLNREGNDKKWKQLAAKLYGIRK